MFRTKILIVTLAMAISAGNAVAGSDGLDVRFGVNGAVFIGPTPVSSLVMSRISAIALQDDGKIVIGGRSLENNSSDDNPYLPAVGRLNSDGTWDTTFADHGLFVLPFGTAAAPFGGDIHTLLWTSKSIVAAGGSYADVVSHEFRSCTLMMELNPLTGALVNDFGGKNSGGNFCFDFANGDGSNRTAHFEGVQLADDNSIYLTSQTTNLDSGAVARFTSEGTIDLTYGNNGIATLPFYSSLLNLLPSSSTSTQQLLATGGVKNISVTRMNHDGSIDTTYGADGVFTTDSLTGNGLTSPEAAMIDHQGRLLITDDDQTDGFVSIPYIITRANADGTIDSTFNGNGQQPGAAGLAMLPLGNGPNGFAISSQPLANGQIVVVGTIDDAATGAARIALAFLNNDSSFVPTYGDSAHPGWASINIGAPTSQNYSTAMVVDEATSLAYIATFATDTNDNTCAVIVRVEPDMIYAGNFELPGLQLCPQ